MFVILFVSLFLPYKYTYAVMVLMCVCQFASAFGIGTKVVGPYIVCEIIFILRTFVRNRIWPRSVSDKKITLNILLLMIWGILITLLGPFLFEGMEVCVKALDTAFIDGLIDLEFGLNNVVQVGYLMVNLMALICVLANRELIGWEFARKVFVTSVVMSVFFGFWEFLSKTTGAVPFPAEFFYRSEEMYTSLGGEHMRMCALCMEASFFGCFIGGAIWGVIVLKKSMLRTILILLLFLCLIFNLSGTGIMTFLAGGLVFLYLRGVKIKYIVTIAFIMGLGILLAVQLGMWDAVYSMVADKQESGSGQARSFTTIRNFEIFVESYGLGVGFGSTRSSSFLADTMACSGLIGTILMARMIYMVAWTRMNQRNLQYIFMFCITMLAGQCMAMPDLSFSYFWLGLFTAAASVPLAESVQRPSPNKMRRANLSQPNYIPTI